MTVKDLQDQLSKFEENAEITGFEIKIDQHNCPRVQIDIFNPENFDERYFYVDVDTEK